MLVVWAFATMGFQTTCSCNRANNIGNGQAKVWHEQLPACPCKNPDLEKVKLNDGWAKDTGDISKYHKGANECFRSYPPIQTLEGASGQQCCYDSNGNLITDGSGAGTPDKVSTCIGENEAGRMLYRYEGVLGHYRKDVKPWDEFGGVHEGWKKYNELWKPNNANRCTNNKVL
jgi:hypothetical protein